MIDDFQHVCITCRDLERSIRFYEKLGLKVIRSITEFNDEGICASIQLPRGHLRVVQLAPPQATGKMFIELVQWLELSSVGGVYPALNHIGINRISFRVSDIDATAAALRHQGITFLSREPRPSGKYPKHRRGPQGRERFRYQLFRDPRFKGWGGDVPFSKMTE